LNYMWLGRPTKYFFVDEAGDLTLFDKKGRSLVGREGVSRCFMIGMIELPDPYEAQRQLEDLREELVHDPYFSGVPSLHPEGRKTALAFHAKDDVAEVRREVIKVLSELGGKVVVALRRKDVLIREYRILYRQTGRKGRPNDVYDDLVTQVFRGRLHPANDNEIVFARRGERDRTKALEQAVEKAVRYTVTRNVRMSMPGEVASAQPHEEAGLQVIDYYLWALQRLFHKGEERFYRALEPQYELVMDVDDKRNRSRGEWYSDANRLAAKKVKPFAS
jgi:Protein of unknown function (DUF3800)